ncbi:MAG: TonB-dependent receptor [Sphingomonas sp.]
MRKLGCAMAGLLVGTCPVTVMAQDKPTQPAQPAQPAQSARGGQTAGRQAPVAAPDATSEMDSEEIVVTGELRGAVKTDIKPEVTLNPADIQAYGASSVGELITALSAQLGSGTGRGGEQPVILLSGRRSTLNEVSSLPPEAIERIDILPEEVALQYGYSASQKVINFVLRNRFQALTTRLEARAPTQGGNSGQQGNLDLLKINRNGRFEFNLNYDHSSGILESERGVTRAGTSLFDTRGNIIGIDPVTGLPGGEIDPALSALAGATVTVAGVPDAAAGGAQGLAAFAANPNDPNVSNLTPYRTLISPQKNLTLKGVYNHTISPHISATANVQVNVTESESLLGLPGVTLDLPAGDPFSPFSRDVQLLRYLDTLSPLNRSTDSQSVQGELSVNADQAPWSRDWSWSFQGSYNRATSETTTDTDVDPVAMQALLDARDPNFNPFAAIPTSLITVAPADYARTTTSTGNVEFLTNGPLFSLPAGKVNASVRIRGNTNDLSSESFSRGLTSNSDISRDTAGLRGNINLPITSRRNAVLDAVGDLSVNANFEVEQLSDFGRLLTTGYGFNWSPITQVQARVSWTTDSNAPSPQQLGNPVITTPNVRVFDYVRGESVNVTSITGGNPNLRADSRHVFNVGLNIKPFDATNFGIVVNYNNQRYRNTAQAFPGATAAIEAAFPDRFVRDPDGDLVSIDYRPVNFASRDRQQLRWGFNLSLPIASPQATRMRERREAFQKARAESQRTGQPLPPEFAAQLDQFRRLGQQGSLFGSPAQPGQGFNRGQGQQQGQGQAQGQGQGQDGQTAPRGDGQGGPGTGAGGGGFRGGGGGGGGGRGGFGGRGGGGGGGNRLFFSAYHTWVFKDQVVISPGLPALDQLSGALSGQGSPAHQVQVQAGIKRDMLSLRLDGSWQSATQAQTGTLGNGGALTFASLTKFNLQAEANVGQNIDLLLKHPWLRGTRIALNVDNLFNAKQRVTDQNGLTPAAYVPNLMDPLGRVVRISVRKLFF